MATEKIKASEIKVGDEIRTDCGTSIVYIVGEIFHRGERVVIRPRGCHNSDYDHTLQNDRMYCVYRTSF
jgi:hypothetical protein